MPGGTVCKEVNSKCKCIVKERPMCQKKTTSCSNDCGTDECVEVYRDLGECLKRAIVSAVKKEKEDKC